MEKASVDHSPQSTLTLNEEGIQHFDEIELGTFQSEMNCPWIKQEEEADKKDIDAFLSSLGTTSIKQERHEDVIDRISGDDDGKSDVLENTSTLETEGESSGWVLKVLNVQSSDLEVVVKGGFSTEEVTTGDRDDTETRNKNNEATGTEQTHADSDHSEQESDKRPSCELCEFRVENDDDYYDHLKTNCDKKSSKCPFCGKRIMKKHNLFSHLRTHALLDVSKRTCKYCRKTFSTRSQCIIHERIHTGVKPYKCRQCNKAFTQKQNRKVHERIHKEKKSMKSGHCNEVFKPTCDLNSQKSLHSSGWVLKVLNVQNSDLEVVVKGGFSTEEMTTGDRDDTETQNEKNEATGTEQTHADSDHSKQESNERPSCELCDYRVENDDEYYDHLKTHCDKKSSKCPLCDKSTAKGYLLHHLRSHTLLDVSKRTCKYCEKTFPFRSRCIIHERIHTDEKPFKCEECSRAFRQKNALETHACVYKAKKHIKSEHCNKTLRRSNGQKTRHASESLKVLDVQSSDLEVMVKGGFSTEEMTTGDRDDTETQNEKNEATGTEQTHADSDHSEQESDKRPSCELCDFRVENDDDYYDHLTTHCDKNSYKCPLCDKIYVMERNLFKHLRSHSHMEVSRRTCKYCGKTFPSLIQCIMHERIHTGEKPYKCRQCNEVFSLKRRLRDHHVRFHKEKKHNKCEYCNKTFRRTCDLNRHKSCHIGKNRYMCEHCDKEFADQQNLQVHDGIHASERLFKCKHCSKVYTKKQHLKEHERIHSGEKPFKCGHCSKTFTFKKHLKEHERIHSGLKPFKCGHCSKSFTFKKHLKDHERIHTGEKPFKCEHCSKTFRQKQVLKRHQSVHTGEKLKCGHCSKTFTQKQNLKNHERIHTGERPFKCRYCNKTFRTSSFRKNHEYIHTSSKPHKCMHCGKGFALKGRLLVHERIHTRVNSYRCGQCMKSFAEKEHLKDHECIRISEKPLRMCSDEACMRHGDGERPESTHFKPYKCLHCDKKFVEVHHLKEHETIHTTDRSFRRFCQTMSVKECDLNAGEKNNKGYVPSTCNMGIVWQPGHITLTLRPYNVF